jgi:hypothetical protein
MEAVVDGGGSDGFFASAANDGVVAAASTTLYSWGPQPPLPPPPSAKDAIAANTIASSSLHPSTASIDNDRCWQRPPLQWPPLTAASINDDQHCPHWQQTTTTGF